MREHETDFFWGTVEWVATEELRLSDAQLEQIRSTLGRRLPETAELLLRTVRRSAPLDVREPEGAMFLKGDVVLEIGGFPDPEARQLLTAVAAELSLAVEVRGQGDRAQPTKDSVG